MNQSSNKMKRLIYSNHGDEIFRNLKSRKFDFANKHKGYEHAINKISTIFETETNVLTEVENNLNSTDISVRKVNTVTKMTDKILADKSKENIKQLNKKISLNKKYKKTLFDNTFSNVNKINNNKSLINLNQQFQEVEKRMQESRFYTYIC